MLWVENDRIEKVKRCLDECMDWWKYGYGENQKTVELLLPNEVIVYRVVMYANPLIWKLIFIQQNRYFKT